MGHLPQIDFEPGEAIGYLTNAVRQGARDYVRGAAAINRAEGFWNSRRASRQHGIGLSGARAIHKAAEEFDVNFRHITGHNQVPFDRGCAKRRMNTRERTASRVDIFYYWITKVTIPVNRSHQSYIARYGVRHGGNVIYQRAASKREQGLIAAHAGTPAARQHERGAFHAEMITLEGYAGS